MMFRIASLIFSFVLVAVVTANEHSGEESSAGSSPEVTVYRLRADNTGAVLRDNNVADVAENLEELMMAHDNERDFLVGMEQYNVEEIFGKEPYYGIAQNDLCVENNGNCSQKCETVGYEAVCSCHEGYTLTSTTDCSASECDNVLSGTSGEFTVDEGNCQWIIKAPKDQIIQVRLMQSHDYCGSYLGYIYDGNSTEARLIEHILCSTGETVHYSSGPNLLIKIFANWNQNYNRLHVSYVTGFKYLEVKAYNSFGNLVVPASSLSEGEECLSLTYSTPQDGSLMVILDDKDDTLPLTPEFSFKHPDGIWKRAIFRIPFYEETKSLKFEFHGIGTRIYNLGRCLNIEYYAIGGPRSPAQETVCRNGGEWSDTTQSCFCPQGFTGVHCEEGCGPNRYGENCSNVCSFLSSACEGTMFCTEERCSCAPGYQGLNCDTPCDSGFYGASCKQRCGKCRNNETCDRYTGRCDSGCSTGFYPPFCQQTYKVLVNAPDILAVTYNSMKIRISFENQAGEGEPIFYEVQYKEDNQTIWSKLSPRTITNETEIEIFGLLPGKYYETKVILLHNDGGSYQTDVPTAKARTKCKDQLQRDYKFAVKEVDETSILFEWSYEHDKTSLLCEIMEFELHITRGSQQLEFPIKEREGTKRVSGIMPDSHYMLQLIGKTVTGKKTLPKEVSVRTLSAAPGSVRTVNAVPLVSGRQLKVTWLPPWGSRGESLRYKVSYQCLYLLACEDVSCEASSGDMEVSATSALLDHLHPHAMYQIQVASLSGAGLASPSYVINATTAHAASHVRPSAAENQTPTVTNTSVLLSWMPPEDCSGLNGYIYGYSYTLIDNDTEEIIQQGTVPETILNLNFSELTPNHCYDTHITLVTTSGASRSRSLSIPFCTTSTAPDRVQSLSVYKRGRRMVGLRWAAPLNTYGDIESFAITYGIQGSSHHQKVTTEPVHCDAWAHLYCYTVPGLSPGKKYHFKVQARNTAVNIDGEPATVEAITAEGASTPPVNLRIVNATESSMLVEWGMPDNLNGQLRSFVILVEQSGTQVSSEECCDEIPMKNYGVTSEKPFYQYEITGLVAASTYSVTVYAKTVIFGEESRIIGHTSPPKKSLPENALSVVETVISRPDIVTLQVKPADRLSGVKSTYILLHLTNEPSVQQPLDDNELATYLQSQLNESYHLISEYTQEELENQPIVTIRLKDLGFISTEIQSQKYALVLVQDYMGNRSIDIFVMEDTAI